MAHPQEIYDLLLDYGNSNVPIQEILIGLTWTFCQAEAIGLCMSPAVPTRTLSWSGTLVNQPIKNLAPWLRSWNNYEATIAMAAINSVINSHSFLLENSQSIAYSGAANLAVFDHFLPLIRNKKVAVIGRYPNLSRYEKEVNMTVIERQPIAEDLPDQASEYILPESEWVFLTATSIPNKTFPRLVELAKNANLVLMGPTVPWLAELADFGINYLAGVKVTNPELLKQTIAEGGGVRIFETGVQYQVIALNE